MRKNNAKEEDDAIRMPQLQKCKNSPPNPDGTNESICHSCTSANRNNNNDKNNCGTEIVTNMETNSVTTNDESSKEKAAEAEAEANVISGNSKNSNDRSNSNSKCYYVETKIIKLPDKNKTKI